MGLPVDLLNSWDEIRADRSLACNAVHVGVGSHIACMKFLTCHDMFCN